MAGLKAVGIVQVFQDFNVVLEHDSDVRLHFGTNLNRPYRVCAADEARTLRRGLQTRLTEDVTAIGHKEGTFRGATWLNGTLVAVHPIHVEEFRADSFPVKSFLYNLVFLYLKNLPREKIKIHISLKKLPG